MPGKALPMRILGLDFGDRNIGLALSDPLEFTAQPFGQYRLSEEGENKKYFTELVQKYKIEEVVVGIPLRMDGSPGTRAQKTKEFAAWLEKAVGCPVVFWDERLTTRQALGIMEEQKINWKTKKEVEHQISAALILQSYLDHRRLQRHAP
jgi:putative Holliday junction resolvase